MFKTYIPLCSLYEFASIVEHPSIANFVVDLKHLILGLSLQQRRPIYESLCLNWVIVLEIQPCNFQIRVQLVVNWILSTQQKQLINPTFSIVQSILLLAGFKWNSDQHSSSLPPVLVALINVSKVLADAGHLLLEGDDARLHLVQSVMGDYLGNVVGQVDQVVADVRQDLPGNYQTDVFVYN